MHPTRSGTRTRGFTIVEILVVLGIITLLLGILVPALSGVRNRARKTEEINNLRQVGMGWNLYANSNRDAALPGYLTPEVQGDPPDPEAWDVTYKYPDGQVINPPDVAAPWTWRLAPHLDDPSFLLTYYEPDMNMINLLDSGGIGNVDPQFFAEHPAFGYNAYYVGGVWDMQTVGSEDKPFPFFYDATDSTSGKPLSVIVNSLGTIRTPSSMLVFCAAVERNPGQVYRDTDDTEPGRHYAVPPFLGEDPVWESGVGLASAGGGIGSAPIGPDEVRVVHSDPSPVPATRHTGAAAALWADLSVGSESPGALMDMSLWVNGFDERLDQHTGSPHPNLP